MKYSKQFYPTVKTTIFYFRAETPFNSIMDGDYLGAVEFKQFDGQWYNKVPAPVPHGVVEWSKPWTTPRGASGWDEGTAWLDGNQAIERTDHGWSKWVGAASVFGGGGGYFNFWAPLEAAPTPEIAAQLFALKMERELQQRNGSKWAGVMEPAYRQSAKRLLVAMTEAI